MARLRGNASEHHPEGPGDGPRRSTKGRRKAASTGMRSSSPAQITAGAKRPASPSVEIPSKRVRGAQENEPEAFSDDEDQLVRETQEAEARDTISSPLRAIPQPQMRRHTMGVLVEESSQDTQSGAQLFKATRRARMSMPAQLHLSDIDEIDGGRQIQFASLAQTLDAHSYRRLRRNHLSEEMNSIESHKKRDAKLRREHDQLRQQVREYEAKIKDLEFQLESARLGNIDITAEESNELQKQLDDAHHKIEELEASSVYGLEADAISNMPGSDAFDDDDDNEEEGGLMLVDPEEMGISQEQMQGSPLPLGPFAARALEASQITMDSLTTFAETSRDYLAESSQANPEAVPDRISDKAVHRYEAEIKSLVQKVADTTSALRLITVELQNMDIIEPGASANKILAALRNILQDGREQYEALTKQSTVGITNADMLKDIFNELQGTHTELVAKTILAEKQNQRITLVSAQYEKAMTLAADLANDKKELERQVAELNDLIANSDERIQALEDQGAADRQLIEEQTQDIETKDATIESLREEAEDKQEDLDRATEAMEQYLEEIKNLTETMKRLEIQQTDRITELEQAHAARVAELEAELQEETRNREEAEASSKEKGLQIAELEQNITDLEGQIADMAATIDEYKTNLHQTTTDRDDLSAHNTELTAQVYEKDNAIENMQDNLDDLKMELEKLRTNLAAEQEQREATEAELAETKEDYEEEKERNRDLGIQANELRSKLFQAQQEKESTVAELNEEIEALNEDAEEKLQNETQHRLEAEDKIDRLEVQISDLQTQLSNTEQALEDSQAALADLETQRAEQIEALEHQLEDLTAQFAALQNTTQEQAKNLEDTIGQLTTERDTLQTTVEDLETTAKDKAEEYAEAVQDRDNIIAGLENELKAAQQANEELATTNDSLSRRVEHEACELLNIMGAHVRETQALNETIAHQKGTIEQMQAAARQTADSHAALIAEKEQEIEELRIVGEARATHIVELEAQVQQLKDEFKVQAEDSQNAIDKLLDTNRIALAKQEEIAAATKKRTQDAMAAVAEMKVRGIEVKTNGANLRKVVSGKVNKVNDRVKVSKKSHVGRVKKAVKMPRDSGIGFDEEDEDLDELAGNLDEGVVG